MTDHYINDIKVDVNKAHADKNQGQRGGRGGGYGRGGRGGGRGKLQLHTKYFILFVNLIKV